MKQETVMKAILGALVVIALLVGCQTSRTIQLPTIMQQQDAPAAVYLEQPEEEAFVSDDPVINTVLMFRKACLEKGAFWIKHQGRTEEFTCELIVE